MRSSPRTWGCFQGHLRRRKAGLVFPTHVGVFLFRRKSHHLPACLPHARGGVSSVGNQTGHKVQSSPRTWGCFYRTAYVDSYVKVFPTHVGVFLGWRVMVQGTPCLPHARGGVSLSSRSHTVKQLSSPRTWGCFFTFDRDRESGGSLPHARGGVSLQVTVTTSSTGSSPRTWGCFRRERLQSFCSTVFPTHVGVFLRCPTPLK